MQKKPLKRKKKKNIQQKYTKNAKNLNKKSSIGFFKFLLYVILFFLIACFILMLVLYNKYLKDLPSVSELENINIAETSKIYDKNGKELYSIFKEKRTYVPFNDISKNVVNALVAGEDKKFWTNPGVDFVGMVRAGLRFATKRSSKIEGTSTLTQQLVRNTIIEKKSNEGSWGGIERKIKEIYLSYQLTKHGSSKEKILELYLNKISYGHNAYGIEEAAKTFFNVGSKDLNVLQASILASLPKGPTYYSPYNHQDRLVGSPVITQETEKEDISVKLLTEKDLQKHNELVENLKRFIKDLKGKPVKGNSVLPMCGINKEHISSKFSVDKNGCSFIQYNDLINFLADIKIEKGVQSIGYNPGRKDYILQRMLEDGYINFDDYKNAILGGIGIKFYVKKERINAPHFVFYVREYLEERYGTEAITMGGLKIYTTLDFEAQKKAEEIVAQQVASNSAKFNAKNGALVSIDNKTGGVVAMVGSTDYYNEDIKGNVNVITSRIQPGSSFKPFVYSVAMEQSKIGTKTPVYDLPTKFPGYKKDVGNFDGKFMGKMSIASALNHSRNIPAIKMYFMAGGTKNILDLMTKLGVTSIDKDIKYGASLSLGTAEMTAIDLAGAYTVFANMGEKVEINPIVKIEDSKGNIIEDNSKPKKEQVISTGQAFLINHILSQTDTRPSFWNKYLDLSDRAVAAKTGTTTKPSKDDQIPANLWTVGYTPQITTVVWTGNSDGENLYKKANGLESSGPIWKNFMEYIHKGTGKSVENWRAPKDVKSIQISDITGYLPGGNSEYIVSSYFKNTPTKRDNSYQEIEYDALCNGPVTDETPKEARKTATVLEFHSLKPDNPAWENPVQAWAKSETAIAKYGSAKGLIAAIGKDPCIREKTKGDFRLTSDINTAKPYRVGENTINIAYVSNSPVKSIQVFLNDELVDTISANETTQGGVTANIFIPARFTSSTVNITLKAVDSLYYTTTQSYKLLVISKDLEINEDVDLEIEQVFEETTESEDIEEISKEIEDSVEEEKNTPKANNTNGDRIPTTTSVVLTKPSSGSIKIFQKDYFNLRATITNASKTEIFIDGNFHKDLGRNPSIAVPINRNEKLSVGKHTILLKTTSGNGEVIEKTVNLEILQ